MAKILCVDDEPAALQSLEAALGRVGHGTVGVANMDAALTVLERGGMDLVLSDYRMPGGSGVALLQAMNERGLDVPLVMVTGHGSIGHAVEAMKEGAVDYVTKPWTPAELEISVEHALEMVRLRRENAQLRERISVLQRESPIIGDSAPLRRILDAVALVAPTRSTVLLTGESGTGKELLARTIHDQSDRKDGPFISINCAAIPETLVESTLFGHERGAFTGAHRRVEGAFERAHRGTLLLDEVTEMRPEIQAKLLRVLQEQSFERVGGTYTLDVDVRIIATTNRDMESLVAARRFREDLYYRLSVVPLAVPPLRDRREDVPLLAQYFVDRTARDNGRPPMTVSPEAMEILMGKSWPGNVRELAHFVERAVIFEQGSRLTSAALRRAGLVNGGARAVPDEPRRAEAARGSGGDALSGVYLKLNSHRLDEAEDELIRLAMSASDENKTHAANLLGINVRTLRKKLNRSADTQGQIAPERT